MAKWQSPEGAETWLSELQELKEKVALLEQRIVNVSKSVFIPIMIITVGFAPEPKQEYLVKRVEYYSELMVNAKDEQEVVKHIEDFMKEYQMYLKSE